MNTIMDDKNILHITVGTSVERGLDLTDELRLLKVALLYGDKVKLCSLASSMLVLLAGFANISEDEKLEILPILYTDLEQVEVAQTVERAIQQYKVLRKKKHRNRQELQAYLSLKHTLESSWVEIQNVVDELGRKANAGGLVSALQSGLVEIQIFEVHKESKKLVEDFFDIVSNAVLSGDTYPLLDDFTGGLIGAAVREGKLALLGKPTSRAQQIGLSSNLLHRLPLFDDASIDEILDIRKELEKPLIRFRSAMIQFAKSIDSAPWDKTFSEEADDVFFQYVAPAILDIEEAFKSNKLLTELITRSLTYSLPTASALGVVMSQLDHFPEIMLGATVVPGVSIGVYESVRKYREKYSEIERNQLYFYYRAGKRLAS